MLRIWVLSILVVFLVCAANYEAFAKKPQSGESRDLQEQSEKSERKRLRKGKEMMDLSNGPKEDSLEDMSSGKRRKNKKNKKSKKNRENPEKRVLKAWADQLVPEQDYNYTHWKIAFHTSSGSDFFNAYARKISTLFKQYEAKVNFALIGACDGLGDKTIKTLYLPNDHWRGVFVEPMGINVRDLIHFMAEKNAAHRSLIIRAAATSFCENETIKVERPLYEEKNASIPHWLRRQIGSVLPKHRDHARKEWIIEEVRCVTARDVLKDWAKASAGSITGSSKKGSNLYESGVSNNREILKKTRIRRPHILKVDVEGHDFDVLMGFLNFDTPAYELPLIIEFEAKSIGKKYPQAKERMESLGYVVSPFGQDGFALLKADRVLESIADEDYFPPEEEPDAL